VAGMVEFTTFFGQKHTPKSLGSFYPRLAQGTINMAHLRRAGGWFLWRLCGIVMGIEGNWVYLGVMRHSKKTNR